MSRPDGEESTDVTSDVVEMDAVDLVEWERDRHTPRAGEKLAELVKQTAPAGSVAEPAPRPASKTGPRPIRAAMQLPMSDKVADPAAVPRAAAPSKPGGTGPEEALATPAEMMRTPATTIPAPQPLMQELLKPATSKHTTSRNPRLAAQTVPTPPAIQTAIQSSTKPSPVPAAPKPAPAPKVEEPVADAETDFGELDDAWDESPKSASGVPDAPPKWIEPSRTKTSENIVRRTGAMPAVEPAKPPPPPVRRTGAMPVAQKPPVRPAAPPATTPTTNTVRRTAAMPAAKSVTQTAPQPTVAPPPSASSNAAADTEATAVKPPVATARALSSAPTAAERAAAKPTAAKPAAKSTLWQDDAPPNTAKTPAMGVATAAKPAAQPLRSLPKPAPAAVTPAEPRAPSERNSEPALLPPPPVAPRTPDPDADLPIAMAPLAIVPMFDAPLPARRDDDWDGMAPSKPSEPKPVRAMPSTDFGSDDDDASREPSVIIDLNAKPVAKQNLDWTVSPATQSGFSAKIQTNPAIQTSELSTTASGVFLMPTAAAPNAKSVVAKVKTPDPEPAPDPVPALPPPPQSETPAFDPTQSPKTNDEWTNAHVGRRVVAPSPSINPVPAPSYRAAPTWEAPAPSAAAWTRPSAQLPIPPPPPEAPQYAPAKQQSAQQARAPSVAEMGWEHDPAIPEPLAGGQETERRLVPGALLATPKTKRTVLIIGGCAAGLVVLIVILLSGGKGASTDPAKQDLAVVTEPPAKPAVVATTDPKPPVAEPPTVPTTTTTPPPTTTTTPPPTTSRPPVRKIAKPQKPLVLDYDKPKDAPLPQDDGSTLARARTAYAAGNQHLFSGEADAAIKSYREALAVYPNYVAGYRGLGLAYAQQGDSAQALKAFKTYAALVPNAKDIGLIQKRIARLSGP